MSDRVNEAARHEPHPGKHTDYACGFSGPHCWACSEPWPCRTFRGIAIEREAAEPDAWAPAPYNAISDVDLRAIRQRRDIIERTQRFGTFTADIVADLDILLARLADVDAFVDTPATERATAAVDARNPAPADDPVVQALIDIERMTKPIGVRMGGEEDRGVIGRIHRLARETLARLADPPEPLDVEHVAETLHMMVEHPLGGACIRCRTDAQVFIAEYSRRMTIKAEYARLSGESESR